MSVSRGSRTRSGKLATLGVVAALILVASLILARLGSSGDQQQATAPVKTCATDLTRDLRRLHVPGLSAAIVKDDRVVCTAVAGVADSTQDKPVTSDTVFTWASVSKTVTATALMQLFDQRRFQLDDEISRHAGFPVRIPSCPREPVTFRQLLTHTSGIEDNSKLYDSLYVAGDSPIPLAGFVQGYLTPGGSYYHKAANFHRSCPGADYSYSNVGAGVIGHLVQTVSGSPFEKYVQEHIFRPLGMADTSFKLADLDQSMLALPNGTDAPQGFPTFPDGTLRSSPTNLGRFLIAYMQGGQYRGQRILRSSTVREMLSNQTERTSGQGLIWYTDSFGQGAVWGHAGSDPGVSSKMYFDPATRTGVLLAANGAWRNPVATMETLFDEATRY